MKKKIAVLGLGLMLLLAIAVPQITSIADEGETSVDIMFLHDSHSHLNEYTTVDENEETITVGGFARIKTLINEQKEENLDTLLLDAGDFSMGTLVQVIYEDEAAELRMLGDMGFEATTLGNHEFDYKAEGLANMLNTAVASNDDLPAMLVCNIDWDSMLAEGLTEEQQLLYDSFENYGFRDYMMVEKNGVNIAVIGVFGKDALVCAPTCPLLFEDPVEAVQETVADIKANEDADMIVCISHSGTWEDESKSEDEILAQNVPELDLIISGHTHTKLDEPIQHGNTYIVSCESYSKYLGTLTMTQNDEGRWDMEEYELVEITTDIEEDEETQEKIDGFVSMIDERYLSKFGYTQDQVLATNDVTFSALKDLSQTHTEQNLGSIIADAYAYAVENVSDDPVDLAVAPSGTIRGTFALGDITVEDVYNAYSIGIGEDGVPGYPLLSMYLTGAELKLAAEIDASISDFMTIARLYTNGLYWNYNPNRMILNKVTDVYLVDDDGNRVELENDKLYHVAVDMYTAQMLGSVTNMSMGLLAVEPKFADGTPIEDYADAIVTADGQEVKAWQAIAQYMESFEDTDGDGIANVPASYATEEGRKVVEDSKNIIDLLKNPNKFFFMIVGIVVLVIVLIILIILLIRMILRKCGVLKKKNKKNKKQEVV